MKNRKKHAKPLAFALSLIMLAAVVLPAMPLSVSAAPASNPTAVDGRTLSREQAGDNSAWIEIAQYQGYSLILRQEPITGVLTTYSNELYNNAYATSLARTGINSWFNNSLSSSSKLRDFTVSNNAMYQMGSMGTSFVDGISLPTDTSARTGDDIAFALSYCEAALYCSTQYVINSNDSVLQTSALIARNNMSKLLPKYVGADVAPAYWLRTPGAYNYAAGCVAYTGGDSSVSYGRAYQHTVIGTYAHYRPALWVGSGIFDGTSASFTLAYNANGGSGAPAAQIVPANTNAVISSTIPVYSDNVFKGWAMTPTATSPQYQPGGNILMNGNITLYAVWELSDTDDGGRILPPELTGDTVDWIEIARNGNYSLILRTSYINIHTTASAYDIPQWQYSIFGLSTAYMSSNVRTNINAWFNGTASGAADKLPADARLREFTMQNNATSMLGTCCNPNKSLTDGLSAPSAYKVGIGNDVSFALSYSEAANYCSNLYFMRELPIANQVSSAAARANYSKINMPSGTADYYYSMWLRSVGDVANTVGSLGEDGTFPGRVFQEYASTFSRARVLTFPALWVDSDIFHQGYKITGQVWPLLSDDIWGIGESFVRSHDVTVELRTTFLTPAPSELSTTAVLLNSGGIGQFTFENVQEGDYVLHISRPGYLTRAMLVSVTAASPREINLFAPGATEAGVFRLWWGDSNDDGRVDNEDILMILELMDLGVSAFHQYYYSGCDFNGDGLIDNEDIQMVLEMWNRMLLDYPGSNGVNPFI